MICTESYFGVAHMHIAVVACKPPTPKVFHLSFTFVLKLKLRVHFLNPECFIAQVVTDGVQNSASGPPGL